MAFLKRNLKNIKKVLVIKATNNIKYNATNMADTVTLFEKSGLLK